MASHVKRNQVAVYVLRITLIFLGATQLNIAMGLPKLNHCPDLHLQRNEYSVRINIISPVRQRCIAKDIQLNNQLKHSTYNFIILQKIP